MVARSRTGMKQVDFFNLERSVQDRFLAACRSEFDPKPILFKSATRPVRWFWLALSPLSVLAMWLLFQTGLGDLEHDMARQSAPFAAVYVVLAVAFALGIVQFIAHRAANTALPYRPGYYLFPACLVDARTTTLGVTPMKELTRVEQAGGQIVVAIGGKTLRFAVEPSYAEQAVSAIKLAQMQCSDELEDSARVLLDPLAPPVVKGPFAPEKPLVERRPLWMKIRYLAALAFGVVGVIIYQKRDAMSDDAMFAAAKEQNDIATYQRYLERGTEHTRTVSRLLLPRAELRLAIAEGTVEAIDRFKERYPDTDIGAEVEQARKRAVEAAFNEAAKPATLDALLAFEKKYPGHHLKKHIEAHKHAIYQRAFDEYKTKKMPKGSDTLDFAKRLVAYSEKQGPIETPQGVRGAFVDVAIRRVPSKALAKADALVKKNPYFVGPRSLPSNHLSDDKLAPVEKHVVDTAVKALSKAFPASVLRVRGIDRLDGSKDLPEVERPTLIISYRIEPSGRNYASAKPRGIYVGLVFFFRVDFLLPGGELTHGMKHVFPVKVPGKMVVAHAKDPEGPLEPKLYDRMSRDALDDVLERYLAKWLVPDLLPKESEE
jgi:hypothetical protein